MSIFDIFHQFFANNSWNTHQYVISLYAWPSRGQMTYVCQKLAWSPKKIAFTSHYKGQKNSILISFVSFSNVTIKILNQLSFNWAKKYDYLKEEENLTICSHLDFRFFFFRFFKKNVFGKKKVCFRQLSLGRWTKKSP